LKAKQENGYDMLLCATYFTCCILIDCRLIERFLMDG